MKSKWLLGIIVLVAFILRIYQLGSIAPSLSWDEVAWGYNAYSIGIDGRDEFGVFLPYKYLESFGDFKPPVYAYLDIVPIKVFGLNAFATRFPSALFGALTVLLTYFLVKQLFKSKNNLRFVEYTALLSSLILAISPWHIMLSRAAFEANIATFFVVSGVLCFLLGVQKNGWWLLLSACAFGLSFYTFNSPRVVVPILALVLVVGFWRKLWKRKVQTIVAGVVSILIVVPLVGFLMSPQADLRFQEVNIFTNGEVVKQSNQEIANSGNAIWAKVLDNRRVGFALDFAKHYLDHFNPTFLFISGDVNPRFSTQDVGELYLWSLPFFLAGVFYLFYKKEQNWWLLPIWMLIGIIPAATARETPHALRIETALPTFQILIAYGFVSLYQKIQWKKITTVIIFVLLACNCLYFLHGYFTHYSREYSQEWQYGYEQAVHFAASVQGQYNHVYVTDMLGRPYIYFLFYNHIPSQTFRQEAIVHRDAFGFVDVQGFGKYSFATQLPTHKKGHNLYINVPHNVPSHAHILRKFKTLGGTTTLVAYTL